jgi:IMP dehydrogenase
MNVTPSLSVSFDDVLLTPQYSSIRSRSEIKLAVELENVPSMRLPIFSSPMDTVTEAATAHQIACSGGIGVVHRYNTPDEQAEIVSRVAELFSDTSTLGYRTIGAAVGVTGDYTIRAKKLFQAGARLICIDVAHGDHILAVEAVRNIKALFGDKIHIMAGNVATLSGFDTLAQAGANSVRVGIGGGSICSTRIQTGHGMPTLQSIIDCSTSEYAGDVKLVADGGIKNSGDIVKALAAGADAVMLGSLLAGTHESPGEFIIRGEQRFKSYRGMASVAAQIDWRGHAASEEGVSTTIPSKGSLKNVLSSLEKGIRSGLSYTGAYNIAELQNKAKFMRISSAGMSESKTHILDK